MLPSIAAFVDRWSASPFGYLAEPPWSVTRQAAAHVSNVLSRLGPDYEITDAVAVHRTAVIECSAIVKGPAIIGPRCFIAASAYLRDGIFLDQDCIIGPGAELKSSFLFNGSKLAHFNFVGDSIIGSSVNLEAGSIVANYRNELDDKSILITWKDQAIETRVTKFGALIGDRARVGANAVIAPGAIIAVNAIIPRLSLIDQRPQIRGTG